jgi:prolyl-tRNA editing enzyme YbaK/EbsC (Cys-tRNA(Pro) deacylase)
VERVRARLIELGVAEPTIREFDERTATAEQAAAALGTTVGRIVKSLVFMADDTAIMALVSGANRVDVSRLSQLHGAPVKRANADQVRAATGFAIGGVPPVGHATPLATYIDKDLLGYEQVWAAAGTATSVFSIDPATLVRITAGQVAEITSAGRD